MEFDETRLGSAPPSMHGPLDESEAVQRTQGDDELGVEFDSARDDDGRGLATRHNKALIAAALFDEPVVPVKIGRFTIVRELGAGGMGVVYVAYDEQLDRRVAVKLLRGADPTSFAHRRLEREAQAMARLSHPNVVTVHEVGEFEQQVFVAMEFVEGQDLRGWLGAEPRDWRAVLEVFTQAGHGLAAAHDAGIVHRDFKPDNVLVGKDGRVKVADFGLAHAFDAPLEHSNPGDSGASHSSSKLDVALTRTGSIMGTPAYMPPEQYAGVRTDARSDQFSFCVALWEGLHGQRPFAGQNLAALSLSISEGRIAPPPVSSEVPAWITAILTRGLSPNPDARWPSMQALLDALGRDPVARRRRTLLAVGLGGGGLALLAGLTWLSVTELRHSARQRYWTGLTEQLLEIERERGLRQANDEAQRARDATRMSVYRRVERDDPTTAAVLLREVEGALSSSSEWISAANLTLGSTISHAVLSGHRDSVGALVISPDGKRLYSGSLDGEVRGWELERGEGELIHAHTKQVTKLVLSPDGKLLVSSSMDGTVRLAELGSPRSSRVLGHHDAAVMDVAFDAGGRWLASASKEGTAQLHGVRDGSTITLRGHGGFVYGVAFDAAGERLLTTSHDGRAELWRVADGELLATFTGHSAGVFHGRILADARVLTASDDGTLRVHELVDGQAQSRVIARHAEAITSLDVHGSLAVTAATDGSMIVSSLDGSRDSVVLPPHAKGTWAVAFTPDGQYVASASFDTTARLTRVDGRGVPRSFIGHRDSLARVAVDPTGRWFATGSYDTDVRIWEIDRPRTWTPLLGHRGTVFSITAERTGRRIVSGSHDGTVRIWDGHDGTLLAGVGSSADGYVNHVAIAPAGDVVGIARGDDTAQLWWPDRDALMTLRGHARGVWQVGFDARGSLLATASFDETARIWSTRDGALVQVLVGHTDKVTGVDFSPDSTRLVTASHDGTVRIWDVQSGAGVAVLSGHTGKISALVRSPDGVTLATASDDGSVRLWPDEESEHALVLRGHDKHVWSIAFDEHGERMLTGSYDGRAMVWNVADGRLLRSLVGHADAVSDAEFTHDGRVITVSNDSTVRIWTLEGDAPAIVLDSQAGQLTGIALTDDGHAASASNDGSVALWKIDQLTPNPEQLRAALLRATIYCLSVDDRQRELGEDPLEAEHARQLCLDARPAAW